MSNKKSTLFSLFLAIFLVFFATSIIVYVYCTRTLKEFKKHTATSEIHTLIITNWCVKKLNHRGSNNMAGLCVIYNGVEYCTDYYFFSQEAKNSVGKIARCQIINGKLFLLDLTDNSTPYSNTAL